MADLDLAGIITRVCANLRLRFSTVAVMRILTSGTKSATVTVDGVKYDLYAPTPPPASTTTPLMDGTASYGSGTSYARSNHVHPTDTSRQATLVSGTNIKTVGGTSLLGSGDIPITITMEDTDVDAAVEEAWPMPGYPIIDYNGYARSITLDGTYGSDVTVLETEALAGSVVTISSNGILIVTDANGDEVSTTYVDRYSIGNPGPYAPPPEYFTVFSFTMPESEVTLSL